MTDMKQCDGCDKIVPRESASAWLRVSSPTEDDADLCSWTCVQAYSAKRLTADAEREASLARREKASRLGDIA
jgi:hypothetical protein